MPIIVKEVNYNTKTDLNLFINFPWALYKGHPYWVPPLKMAVKEMLNPKHPFYKTADVKYWIAFKDGKMAGRIMAIDNFTYNEKAQKNVGYFGFFDVIDDKKVSKVLIETATDFLKSRNRTMIEGPMNPGTNYECGLLVDGFKDSPQIMMTYNHPYYIEHLNELGFTKEMDLLAYKYNPYIDLPEVIRNIAKRTQEKSKISYRFLNVKNWTQELDLIFEMYNSAWQENWGFVPMSREEFDHTAKELKMIVNPDFVQFVLVDGVEAGFILVLPDYNQILKQIPSGKLSPLAIFKLLTAKKRISRLRVIMMGIKKEYRKMGIETLLYTNMQNEILKNPLIKECELSWILETNLEMNKPLIRMTGEAYKRYRLLSKLI